MDFVTQVNINKLKKTCQEEYQPVYLSKEFIPKYFFLAIDVDETLIENGFPDISKAEINWEVIHRIELFENELKKQGFTAIRILWTCRSDNSQGYYLTDALDLLKQIDFRIDYVNENPLCPYTKNMGTIYTSTPKIFYHVLIDDRTLNMTRCIKEIIENATKEFKKSQN